MKIIIHFPTLAVVFLMASLGYSCAGLKKKSDKKIDPILKLENRAKKGDMKAWKTLEAMLKAPQPKNNPNLHERLISDLGKINHKESKRILKPYLNSRVEGTRKLAILSYLKQREFGQKKSLELDLLKSIDLSYKKIGKLKPIDIQALGLLDSDNSTEILKANLGLDEENDALIIQALGRKLEKEKKQELKESNNSSEETEMPEGKGGDDSVQRKSKASDIEATFIAYLQSDKSDKLKKLTLSNIVKAYQPRGDEKLLSYIRDNRLSESVRAFILDYLIESAIVGNKKQASRSLRRLYRKSRGLSSLRESIIVALSSLEKKDYDIIKNQFLKKKRRRRYLYRKALSLKRTKKKRIQKLKSLSVYKTLQYLFAETGLSNKTLIKMQKKVSAIVRSKQLRRRPESRLIYSALKRIYPKADFYSLNKKGESSLKIPGFFSSIMKLSSHHSKNKVRQRELLKVVWGLSEQESKKIQKFYKKNKKLIGKLGL